MIGRVRRPFRGGIGRFAAFFRSSGGGSFALGTRLGCVAGGCSAGPLVTGNACCVVGAAPHAHSDNAMQIEDVFREDFMAFTWLR
jgi:hypothetical protein